MATLSGFLATRGTTVPGQTGNSGKYLTTDGTAISWGTVDLSSKASLSGATFTGEVDVVSPTTTNSIGVRQTTVSTSAPSGGSDGDIWIVYA